MAERLVYRVEEVAELLGCGRSTVYDAVERGELPGVLRLGKRILISKAALHTALGLTAAGTDFPHENGDGPAANGADAKSRSTKQIGVTNAEATSSPDGSRRRP